MFPKLDEHFPIANDEKLVLDCCRRKNPAGTGFRLQHRDKQHLRVVFLPRQDTMADAMGRLANFLEHYRQ